MRLANPWFLTGLLVVPLYLRHYFRREKGRGSNRLFFPDTAALKKTAGGWRLRYQHAPAVLRAIVLTLTVIALARPQMGNRNEEILTEGIDIIMALDISGSMAAEDLKPVNRIQAAKLVIEEFIRGRKNDRIGLVVFAGKSFTQCPLTLDYDVLTNLLAKVNLGMVKDGTAIGMAVANSVNRLRASKAKSKIVVLLTDGMNNKGKIDPLTAAKAAQAMGIKIYTVGVGREGGAPIPIQDPVFGKTYARAPDGSLYLTQIDEDTLRKIAELSGARFFRATDERKLTRIYEEIDRMEKTEIKVKEYLRYTELFPYVLGAALFLLLAEIVLSYTWLRRLP
ncbi:MAG: VWA domain-containing protein [bacterium]